MVVNYGVVGTGYFGAELARYEKKMANLYNYQWYDPENAQKLLNKKNQNF